MYIFYDNDKNSLTYGSYCIRDGDISYDGFLNLFDALLFLNKLN